MSSLLGLSMAPEEDIYSLEAKFAAAVKVIRSLPEEGPFQPSDDMMLMFYSYYKQATLGPCNIPRPSGFWDSRGKAKWDAWSSLGNMTREEAMKNYIEDIQLILETIPISDEVSDLVLKLGSFYTEVEEEAEETETEKRPFTRPFTNRADELGKPFEKPTMEGYGDLWDDIQNLEETDKEIMDLCVSEEIKESNEFKKHKEEDNSEGGDNTEDEDKEEETDELGKPFEKPTMEGYGDLWDDIQNLEETDKEIRDLCVSAGSEESKESNEFKESEEEDNSEGGDNTEDEDEEEETGWSPDPRRLMVEDNRWMDTRGSSSSMEPSGSSFTNGTHSSLNSEVEEEELGCSLEPSVQYNPYLHLNGHLSAPTVAVPEKNYRSTDSDNEEFCDSMEHLAMEEGLSASKVQSRGSGAASMRQNDLWFESNSTLNGEEDQLLVEDSLYDDGISTSQYNNTLSRRGRGPPSPRPVCSSQLCVNVDAACCCVSQSRHALSVSRGNVNEQIATALLRLQRDMASVLHRLQTLEVLTQSRSSSPRPEDLLPAARKFPRPSWWPFDFSPFTVVMTALWPLFAHWLFHFYLQRKRRKIT